MIPKCYITETTHFQLMVTHMCHRVAENTSTASPRSCRHYYICKNDKLIRKLCPKGFAYSEEEQNCMPESDVDCIVCPMSSSTNLFADPSSCNHYYQCSNGIRTKWACKNGERFDRVIERCRPRAQVKCDMENVCRYHRGGEKSFLVADANDCRRCNYIFLYVIQYVCILYIVCPLVLGIIRVKAKMPRQSPISALRVCCSIRIQSNVNQNV